MKRGFKWLLGVSLAASICMSGCGFEAHEHEFATTYSSDETGHWYDVTCEHTDIRSGFAKHTDDNNDGVCNVCNYDVHGGKGHTYAEAFSQNELEHWREANCGHSNVAVIEKAEHADGNYDGLCDACGYEMYEDGHVHTFEAAYSFDETYHWNKGVCHTGAIANKEEHVDDDENGVCDKCLYTLYGEDHEHTFSEDWAYDEAAHWHACETHAGVKKDEEAHADADADGLCDVCGVDILENSVNLVKGKYNAAANMGRVVKSVGVASDENEPTKTEYFYELGEGYLHVYDWENLEKFLMQDGNEVVAVEMSYGNLQKAYGTYTTEALKGYEFMPGNNASITAYGPEDAVVKLYEGAKANDTLTKVDVASGYAFSGTNNGQYSGYDYNYTVTFEIENGCLTFFKVVVTPTSAYEEQIVYEIWQNAGERTAKSPYPLSGLLPVSYNFTDKNGDYVEDGAEFTLTMGADETITLNVVDVAPVSASLAFDTSVVTCINEEGDTVEGVINAYLNKDYYTGAYTLDMSHGDSDLAAGTYTVTVETANVTYSFKVTLKVPEVNKLTVQINNDGWGKRYNYSMYTGETLKIKGVVNSYANGAYTASVTSDNAADATLTSTDVPATEWVPAYTRYDFTPNAAGTYVITLVSAENAEITSTLTVRVTTPSTALPTAEELLSGIKGYIDESYGTVNDGVVIEFTPVSEGATSGTAILKSYYEGLREMQAKYAYSEADGTITLTEHSGDVFEIELSIKNYQLIVVSVDGWPYDWTLETFATPAELLSGAKEYFDWQEEGITIEFTPASEGATSGTATLTFEYLSDPDDPHSAMLTKVWNVTYAYNEEDGTVALTEVSGDAFDIKLSIENYQLIAMIGYNNWTLV